MGYPAILNRVDFTGRRQVPAVRRRAGLGSWAYRDLTA